MGIGNYIKKKRAQKLMKKAEGYLLKSANTNNLYESDEENESTNPMFDSVRESQEEELHAYANNYDEKEEVKDAAEEEIPSTEGTSDLEKLYKALNESEKGGKKGRANSNKFAMVTSSLLSLNNALKAKSFGHENAYDDVREVIHVSQLYGDLIKWCDVYTDRSALTGAGKARKELVEQIKALAQKDAVGIGHIMDELGGASRESRESMTWDKLLKNVRTEKFKVDDLESVSGGQASEVFKFHDKTVETEDGGGKLTFFKPETIFDLNENPAMWALQKYRQLYPDEEIKKEELKKFKTGKLDEEGHIGIPDKNGNITTRPDVKHPESLTVFAKMAYTNDVSFFEPGGMKGKGSQNVTGRNVATSRIAELLGVGDLVVKSKFAEVEFQGKKQQGVVMEAASGMSANEYTKEMKEKLKKNDKLKKNYQGSGFLRTSASIETHQGENEIMTPEFLKEITNLQVLDIICGQADRHNGNMFFKTEGDKITGVQGIDNDGAFFMNEKAMSNSSGVRRDRDIYSDEGELTIPHMDAQMAERVMALSPEAVKFALCDILDEDTIKATINRLNKTKQAIGNAQKGQIIQGDEWRNPRVKDDLMKGITSAEMNKLNDDRRSYKDAEKKKLLESLGVSSDRDLSGSRKKKYDEGLEKINAGFNDMYFKHEAKTSYLNFVHEMMPMYSRKNQYIR